MTQANETTALRVLVTGATGGIGRAICRALLIQAQSANQQLCLVAAASGPGPDLGALVAELHRAGARAIGIPADLTSPGECRRLVAETLAFSGGLDGLVSNAGIVESAPLAALSVEEWDRVFAVNTRATWLLAHQVHHALTRSHGSIVAIASVSGMIPHPNYGAYSASKAALIMLCRQLAQEWACDEIRVNTVSPGMVHTRLTDPIYKDPDTAAQRYAMVPLGRVASPEDIAAAVVYLLGPASAYITGENLRLDGGLCDSILGRIPGIARSSPAADRP